MSEAMKELLMYAIDTYGVPEFLLSKEKVISHWDKCSCTGSAVIASNPTDLQMRSAIMGLGRILEEDTEKHIYITTVKCRSNEALAVLKRKDETVEIAACAQEGLIPQHIAQNAVALIEERFKKR